MPRRARRSSKPTALPPTAAILLLLIALAVFAYRQFGVRDPQSVTFPTRPAEPRSATLASAAPPTTAPGAPTAAADEGIQVFFSDPFSDGAGPDQYLARAIAEAQASVDMAIYNLSAPSVIDALLDAHQRGVQVRLVMESESMDKNGPERLAAAGIPITGDRRDGLMHNKFTIIDGQEVWTGSMNYTLTGAYDDFNNVVQIRSRNAALSYTTEFEEMFAQDLFGPDTRAETPYPWVTVAGDPVEIYFSPDDGAADRIIAAVRGARQSIDFMAYSFTNDELAEAVRERAGRGVQVRGVFDESQVESNEGGEFAALRKAGLDVRLDGIDGLMHNKIIIIDSAVVVTGSYNFSRNAERTNDENVVILHDPDTARLFAQAFEQVYGSGKQ